MRILKIRDCHTKIGVFCTIRSIRVYFWMQTDRFGTDFPFAESSEVFEATCEIISAHFFIIAKIFLGILAGNEIVDR